MRRAEFLDKLKKALSNDLSNQIVQENINYYNDYITEEIHKGRNEEEVIAELGDPWVIAQTVINMQETTNGQESTSAFEATERNGGFHKKNAGQGNVHVFSVNGWWKILLVVLGIIGIFALVLVVIGGIFSFLAPILVPCLVVLFVIRLFKRTR